MKLWTLATFCTASLLILSGCTASPKPEDGVAIDATLPVVKLTAQGTIIDINAIAFEWKPIKDERVKGIYIYKQTMNIPNSKLAYYATIYNRFTTHYADNDIKPDTAYTYSFKTFSEDAESKMNRAKVVNSLPVLQSVVWIKSVQNMPRSAKIIWRPHVNQKVKSYIIERRTLEEDKWYRIAQIDGRLNAEYIDADLKDNFVYKYRVRVLTFDEITSTPSEIVKVVTKALPITVTDIVATKDLPKKIVINWKKSITEDFTFYHLYRAKKSDGFYKLIAKLHNNTFTDILKEDGKEFYYRVSAFEKYGLESIHDKLSIQGISLIKPQTPALIAVKLVDGKIEIKWNNTDPRVKDFIVIKKSKTGWFEAKEEEIVGITGNEFIDTDIVPNTTYYYKVYGIDKYSIKSDPSIEIELRTPIKKKKKNNEIQEAKGFINNSKLKQEDTGVVIPTQDFE